jgi:two-component system phosphate regulon sensor histidine kinase PhoR
LTGRVRSKLLVASFALIVVAGVASTLYLRAELRQTVEHRVESELIQHALTARIGLEALPVIDGEVGAATARRFADATGARLEVIADDGRVIVDSAGEPAASARQQPEVVAAFDPARGRGVAHRGARVLVAVSFERDGGRGAIRVSAPLRDLGQAYDRLYVLLTFAGVVGLLVSVVMTWLATHLMSSALHQLATSAREMARVDGRRRITVDGGDDLGDLGASINHMADDARRSRQALSRQQGLLGSVLESMSQGVIALDRDRRVTIMNDAAVELLGLPGAPVGEALLDHVRAPALIELTQPPFTAGSAEIELPGGIRLVARVAPARVGDGAIVILEDVTNMRRLETIRRDFVANVSHELRTPVSVIRANAETLLSGALQDERFATRMLEGLHRNAERLSRILADLLDLSRLEAGEMRAELGPVEVADAVHQAVASVDSTAQAKQITIAVDVADDLAVRADGKALDQILVNLIENAVKYTPAGGHIWVHASPRGERIRIEVRDDGPGIAPQHRERIFERFYRVDPGRSRDMGGTGLGLSIVKHLVETMNGAIGVEDNRPHGSVFWIALALAPAGADVESS